MWDSENLFVIHRDVELAGPERVDIDVGEALVEARELVHGAALTPELVALVQGRAHPSVSVEFLRNRRRQLNNSIN